MLCNSVHRYNYYHTKSKLIPNNSHLIRNRTFYIKITFLFVTDVDSLKTSCRRLTALKNDLE